MAVKIIQKDDGTMCLSFIRGDSCPLKFQIRDVEDKTVLKEDLKLYKSLGFEYISSFACYLGQDYIDLYGEPKITSLK